MFATTFAWGFWPAWVAWMAIFVAGSMVLSELVGRAAEGSDRGGPRLRRLIARLLGYATDDPVARWAQRIGGVTAVVTATIALGPPITVGVLTLARSRRPSRRVSLAISVLYASIWVTTYTWIASLVID
jgi:hypothetical protein